MTLPKNAHGVEFFTLRNIADAEKREDINDLPIELSSDNKVIPITQAGAAR